MNTSGLTKQLFQDRLVQEIIRSIIDSKIYRAFLKTLMIKSHRKKNILFQ